MKTTQKIIRLLIEHPERTYSIRSIAQTLNINYRIAFEKVNLLEKKGTIKIERLGNSNQCSFTYSFTPEVQEVENLRLEKTVNNKNINLVKNRITSIQDPFFIAVLFGSYAKQKQGKPSDIDVCIISDSKKTKDAIHRIVATIPSDIHLVMFTADEFRSMIQTTKENVGKEIVRNHIILTGAEAFYRLINHV
jgi:predicted nucleotidyltransferase/predicted transcriptional regulator